jgi:xanthine phosphoribosyltransferase
MAVCLGFIFVQRGAWQYMQTLQDYIRQEATVLSDRVLKVNSFLNHQVNPSLVMDIGKDIAERFRLEGLTKVLTIEASGIHIAFAVALNLNVPFVYAKKTKAITQSGDTYSASVYSFTRQETYQITVSKEFLAADDRVLIVDDILAEGAGVSGLLEIIEASRATLVGASVVIEKSFQNGRKVLDGAGIPLYALARIGRMSPTTGIEFL